MRTLFAATLLLLFATAGVAQTPRVVSEVEAKLWKERADAERDKERDLDVEILRRLLNQSLGLPNKVTALTIPLTTAYEVKGLERPQRVSSTLPPFDGLYLSGVGVVYTLHVPASFDMKLNPATHHIGLSTACARCHEGVTGGKETAHISTTIGCTTCHVGPPPDAKAATTDWDRVREELSGAKVVSASPAPKAKAERAPVCQPGDVADMVARVLHANAKNLRHLGEKDHIRVVVTFDDLPGTTAESAPATKIGFTPDELQHLTLGELHVKQQKYMEAAAAYETALARFRTTNTVVTLPANVAWDDVKLALLDLRKGVRGAYKSLATVYLQLGEVEKSKAALTLVTAFELSVKNAGEPKPLLPAKMIVTVPKAEVTRAGEYADFLKTMKVERTNFPK